MNGKLFAGFLIALLAVLALPARALTLTPGQTVTVREGDQWSSATFLTQEGRKFHVRYSDGTEEWITIDRIRPDAATGTTSADTGAAPTAKSPAAGIFGTGRSITLTSGFTQIPLHRGHNVAKRATVALAIKPTTRPSSDFTDLTPASGVELGNVEKLLYSPDAPGVFVAVGGRRGDDTPLLVLNTNNPPAADIRTFTAKDQQVVAAADGGNILISQPATFRGLSLHAWVYKDQTYQLRANYTFIEDRQNKVPEAVIMLTPGRMLMRSGSDNYLIDLASTTQLAYLECGDVSWHSSGKFLMAVKDRNGILIRPTDLAIIGSIPNVFQSFAVDPTATLAAYGDDGGVNVVKVSNAAPVAHVQGVSGRGRLTILGPTNVLIDGSIYYDTKTGIPAWSYQVGQTARTQLANGQMLYVGNVNGQTLACMASLPDVDGLEALQHASPSRFSLAPGAHIAIVGDLAPFGDAARAHKNLENVIASAGDVYDPDSAEYKLTVKAAAGPTGVFSSRIFRLDGPPLIKDIPAPSTIVDVTLTRGDAVIWSSNRKYQAQFIVMRTRDQSLEDAVADAGKINADSLNGIHLPGYIVKGQPGQASTLGASTLSRAGFTLVTNEIRR